MDQIYRIMFVSCFPISSIVQCVLTLTVKDYDDISFNTVLFNIYLYTHAHILTLTFIYIEQCVFSIVP